MLQPEWITINQEDQSVTVTTDSITSVFSTNLIFSARLFTISLDSNEISTNRTSSFSFTNNNWYIESYNSSYYLVRNTMKEMYFKFGDNEQDSIKVKVTDNQNYGVFLKFESSLLANFMFQSSSIQTDPVEFSFLYTDSYHQLDGDWK